MQLSKSMADEEAALIEAVRRVKAASPELTAAQVLSALENEGMNVTLSQVKKAASKASKQAPKKVETAIAAPAPTPGSKAQTKKGAAAESALKAAESAMMAEQKKLRDYWINTGEGRVPPHEGKGALLSRGRLP